MDKVRLGRGVVRPIFMVDPLDGCLMPDVVVSVRRSQNGGPWEGFAGEVVSIPTTRLGADGLNVYRSSHELRLRAHDLVEGVNVFHCTGFHAFPCDVVVEVIRDEPI